VKRRSKDAKAQSQIIDWLGRCPIACATIEGAAAHTLRTAIGHMPGTAGQLTSNARPLTPLSWTGAVEWP
jgi:hypothetical protein